MEFNLQLGLVCKAEKTVAQNDTAVAVGSGTSEVFATPMMVALMECAAVKAVQKYLPEGYATVGTGINIQHTGATLVGKNVWATAELTEIDRKKLVFKVAAFDEDKQIGEGVHQRFIIDEEKFMNKLK